MNDRIGALFSWDDGPATKVSSKIGLSFISSDRADSYKNSEIPSWTLSDTVDAARKEWNEDVFSKVRVPLGDSANKTHIRLLYSSLYFMHLIPSDRMGENPLWESDEPYWDDFYTLCTRATYFLADWCDNGLTLAQGIFSVAQPASTI